MIILMTQTTLKGQTLRAKSQTRYHISSYDIHWGLIFLNQYASMTDGLVIYGEDKWEIEVVELAVPAVFIGNLLTHFG